MGTIIEKLNLKFFKKILPFPIHAPQSHQNIITFILNFQGNLL